MVASQEIALAFGHHEDRTPTHGYELTREPGDGGVREELAAAEVDQSAGLTRVGRD
jgi:hypothetical protein